MCIRALDGSERCVGKHGDMHVCIFVCVCVCMYTLSGMRVCSFMCTYQMYARACVCVCVYTMCVYTQVTHICVCMQTNVMFASTYVVACMRGYLHICICLNVCIYIYIHTYTHMRARKVNTFKCTQMRMRAMSTCNVYKCIHACTCIYT